MQLFNFRGPVWESTKEIARWVILFAISWVITETLKQVNLVPEFANVKVWVFAYTLPIRAGLQFALTFAGRFVDKYLFEKSKDNPRTETKGLLPF